MLRAHTFKDFQEGIIRLDTERNILKWALREQQELIGLSYIQIKEWREQDTENRIKNSLKRIEELEAESVLLKNRFYEGLNMWTFDYPILMAADIIGYDVDVVPVGKDQLQHLEMARDMARYVNHHYGEEILREPKAIIDEDIAVIPGLDGRKMSKSYNNYISMFESSADLKKKIATIPTDTKTLEEPKDPDTCNVFAMIRTFGEKKEVEEIRMKYKKGGYGYWHAKQDLHVILDWFIAPYRESYEELNKLSDEELFAPIRRGNAKMQKRMDEVLERLKKYIGT